jgi:hypothetical protein
MTHHMMSHHQTTNKTHLFRKFFNRKTGCTRVSWGLGPLFLFVCVHTAIYIRGVVGACVQGCRRHSPYPSQLFITKSTDLR